MKMGPWIKCLLRLLALENALILLRHMHGWLLKYFKKNKVQKHLFFRLESPNFHVVSGSENCKNIPLLYTFHQIHTNINTHAQNEKMPLSHWFPKSLTLLLTIKRNYWRLSSPTVKENLSTLQILPTIFAYVFHFSEQNIYQANCSASFKTNPESQLLNEDFIILFVSWILCSSFLIF